MRKVATLIGSTCVCVGLVLLSPARAQPPTSGQPGAAVPSAAPQTETSNPQVTKPWHQDPNWWQVVLTVLAGVVATTAFLHERETVRLTQRADVLFDSSGIEPKRSPQFLTAESEITLVFKNYGPTRASNVRIVATLEIERVSSKAPAETPPLPSSVIGAGETLAVGFPSLGMLYEIGTIQSASRGDLGFWFKASVTYDDVFGRSHRTTCSGKYYGPAASGFVRESGDDAS